MLWRSKLWVSHTRAIATHRRRREKQRHSRGLVAALGSPSILSLHTGRPSLEAWYVRGGRRQPRRRAHRVRRPLRTCLPLRAALGSDPHAARGALLDCHARDALHERRRLEQARWRLLLRLVLDRPRRHGAVLAHSADAGVVTGMAAPPTDCDHGRRTRVALLVLTAVSRPVVCLPAAPRIP